MPEYYFEWDEFYRKCQDGSFIICYVLTMNDVKLDQIIEYNWEWNDDFDSGSKKLAVSKFQLESSMQSFNTAEEAKVAAINRVEEKLLKQLKTLKQFRDEKE